MNWFISYSTDFQNISNGCYNRYTCYLCSKTDELWNNHSVSPCSLTPTGMGRRETLWSEGSYKVKNKIEPIIGPLQVAATGPA